MTTQAFIKFKDNSKDYEDMLWVNHDAFPDVVVPLIKQAIDESTTNKDIIAKTISTLNKETSGNGKFFTIEKRLDQEMEYIYNLEIWADNIFLRIQETRWIDNETFEELPPTYLESEMRTTDIIKIK